MYITLSFANTTEKSDGKLGIDKPPFRAKHQHIDCCAIGASAALPALGLVVASVGSFEYTAPQFHRTRIFGPDAGEFFVPNFGCKPWNLGIAMSYKQGGKP